MSYIHHLKKVLHAEMTSILGFVLLLVPNLFVQGAGIAPHSISTFSATRYFSSRVGCLALRGGGTVEPALKQRIETLLHSSQVILFMKGTPDRPQV